MVSKTVKMDAHGRIVIPKSAREALKLGDEAIFRLEIEDEEIVMKPLKLKKDAVKAMADMELPVGPWEKMEKEIEKGASGG